LTFGYQLDVLHLTFFDLALLFVDVVLLTPI
jgi:hypothetical protein